MMMMTSWSLVAASLFTPLSLASTPNFCPVEGSDYFEKDEGNMIKVSLLINMKKDFEFFSLGI